MALLLALPARGEEFGRLFTTPEERALLERLRYAPATEVKEKEETLESVVPKADVPPSITLNGIVSRSGGNSTLWINGLNRLEGDLDAQHIRIDPHRAGEVVIRLPNSPTPIRLKPGETYDPSVSTVIDVYQQSIK